MVYKYILGAAFLVQPLAALADLPRETLQVARDGQSIAQLSVEVAQELPDVERGLMFREQVEADSGMLFLYQQPANVAFWMKNTLVPLDMIFIDRAGRVVNVHEGAIPHDLTPIYAGQPVIAVLEVAAGQAKKHGITVGTEIISPSMKNF